MHGNAIRVLSPLVLTDAELEEALAAWKTRSRTSSGRAPVAERELVANRYELGSRSAAAACRASTAPSTPSSSGTSRSRSCTTATARTRITSTASGARRAPWRSSHPHVVTVIDRGEEDGRQFIVFELVDGEDLKALVERGPLPVRRVLELGLEIGAALAFAHGQGLVHRDVKPQNVLLDGEGRAKVTDFGIVRSLEAVGTTETGTVLGTSHYVAPEQARGEKVDAKTDVYSFGVVLFELLAGEVPYTGDSFVAVALRHVNEPVPDVLERRPDTPLRLAELVGRCLAKSPADRPSMDEVVADLAARLAELDAKEGEEATMIVRRPAAAAPRRRLARPATAPTPAAAAAGARGALLAAAVGILLLARRRRLRGGKGAAVRLQGVASFDSAAGRRGGARRARRGRDRRRPGDLLDDRDLRGVHEARRRARAGRGLTRALERIELTSDTPGFTAEIRAGDSREGPFETVGASSEAGAETTWELDGDEARYYVVWITALEGVAHVNEVSAPSTAGRSGARAARARARSAGRVARRRESRRPRRASRRRSSR